MILQIITPEENLYGIIAEDEKVQTTKWKYLVLPLLADRLTNDELDKSVEKVKQFIMDHFADDTVVHVYNDVYMLWIVS